MSTIHSFAPLIKAGRAAAGLTQAQLAEAAGLGRVYIAQLENGTRCYPSYLVLRQLCVALGPDFIKAVTADLETALDRPKKSRKKSV